MTPEQYRREGFQAGIEAAARITKDGYRCRSCGQVFLNDNGHSDANCPKGYSNWDTATDAQKAAAIRAIDVDEVLEKVGGEIDRRDHLENGPARLWMHEGSSAPWFVKPAGNSTEYVRADLSPAPDAVAQLVKTARALRPYLDWTIGPDSPGYHPTMTSAVAAFKEALASMEANDDH